MEVEEPIVETGALMLVLENTHTRAGGTVLTPELTAELAGAAQRHGAYVHLDGARLFNAAVALGVPVSELAAPVNTVAVSLNKGLCAPMGAILAGPHAGDRARAPRRCAGSAGRACTRRASRPLRRSSRSTRSSSGSPTTTGGRASSARCSRRSRASRSSRREIETNIVLVDVSGTELYPDEFLRLLAERGVLGMERDTSRVRFVTHRLIGDAESLARRPRELVAALRLGEHARARRSRSRGARGWAGG